MAAMLLHGTQCFKETQEALKKLRLSLRLDGLIRANGFADSRESPDHAIRKSANRRFKVIRANRSNVMKIRVFLRIDSNPRFALQIAVPSKPLRS